MKKVLYVSAMIVLVCSCTHQRETNDSLTSGKVDVIADTITYDVIVKNPNPDDKWTEQCLGHFKREQWINMIMDNISKGEMKALDYETGKPISWQDIQKMKVDNNNKMVIGKLQFKEVWTFDKLSMSLIKKVHSIIFGYETYTEEGQVRNYKAAFKINFK